MAFGLLSAIGLPKVSWAQVDSPISAPPSAAPSAPPFAQITVNSTADGLLQPDSGLTLREAIELTNGTLSFSDLSAVEQQLVVTTGQSRSEIRFDLPMGQTTIELEGVLPAIAQPNLILDGTTQPGYSSNGSATAEIAIPIPIVTLRPANGIEVFRGLTLAADNITVRGLSLYGFNSPSQITQSTPPADIFISNRQIPLNRETPLPSVGAAFPLDHSPKGIVIEQNWLGLSPDGSRPAMPSGFGVSVFDSAGTTIRQNRIQYHNGSGIISGRQADNLTVLNNIIVGNGTAGMPDAIRLDGQINEGLISGNLLCGNDGSGVFVFRPSGSVTIANNHIRFNGQRFRRAAVYLIGDNHQVVDNDISAQKGGGVVVGQSVNTVSQGNVITGNRFSHLEGLSIDLTAREDRAPRNYQYGDGINPRRNSENRRRATANGAVDAPQFVSSELLLINGRVVVSGQADANNEIQLYRTTGKANEHGPLSEPITTTTAADAAGKFEFELDELKEGEVLSAIATDPIYGTSEPASNTLIRSLTDAEITTAATEPIEMPQCTSPLAIAVPPTSPPTEVPLIPTILQLTVPRNIHFALDEDFISSESAAVLDKIAEVLRQYPSIVVDLHGHTDSRASQTYNQDLARRRAENARRYLLNQGIGAERMTLRSFGETALLVNETDRANYARNRRVEFVFKDVRGVSITFVNQERDLQIE
ncbi:MAG: OmpA family protein [Phormidesmis sp.]